MQVSVEYHPTDWIVGFFPSHRAFRFYFFPTLSLTYEITNSSPIYSYRGFMPLLLALLGGGYCDIQESYSCMHFDNPTAASHAVWLLAAYQTPQYNPLDDIPF